MVVLHILIIYNKQVYGFINIGLLEMGTQRHSSFSFVLHFKTERFTLRTNILI